MCSIQMRITRRSFSWRATNENAKRLLRQCFLKGVSMKEFTQDDLSAVAARLNSRLRETLDFDSWADRLKALLY